MDSDKAFGPNALLGRLLVQKTFKPEQASLRTKGPSFQGIGICH